MDIVRSAIAPKDEDPATARLFLNGKGEPEPVEVEVEKKAG
jgi:hypothetical protein